VIISPHSASTLAEENEVLVELFLDNLTRYLDGPAAPQCLRPSCRILKATSPEPVSSSPQARPR
jgi:phosphoglycerate dehydrogenase-like enzyme